MKLEFDIEKLQKVADDFYFATGIGIYIIAEDFTDIKVRRAERNQYCQLIRSTPMGKERCILSDKLLFEKCKSSGKPEIHICHAGLVNVAAPILFDSAIIGYVFFQSTRKNDFSEASKGMDIPDCDTEKLSKAYEGVPEYDEARFKSVISLSLMLIEHVMLSGMIKPSAGENLLAAKRYIYENLDKDLSVKAISGGTNISKSVLYRLFDKNCGMTVSEYVNKKRIDKAKELLSGTEFSITEIARRTGYQSGTYFRMSFKKLTGVTPTGYRHAKR